MKEIKLITDYFQRPYQRSDVVLGIGDDCALLEVPVGHQLVTSMDLFISGVHFPVDTSPDDIGYKVLAASLSDLAAMGAEPAWVLLGLTLPGVDQTWLQGFSSGFFECAEAYKVDLVGGDLTRGPAGQAVVAAVQVMGFLPEGQGLRRDGAKAGDFVAVTGSLGGAGLALMAAKGEVRLSKEAVQQVMPCLNRPQARMEAGQALCELAHACIDISDGLIADLERLVACSGVAASLVAEDIPLHKTLSQALPVEQAVSLALSAGDDYELCFTFPPDRLAAVEAALKSAYCPYAVIGKIAIGAGVEVHYRDGRLLPLEKRGYEHFTE